MTSFVLIALLLFVLTLALLTRRLWMKSRQPAAAQETEPIAAMRQQIEQLAALHKAGVLGEAQYSEARNALERRVVDSVVNAPITVASGKPAPASRRLLIALSSFVCVVVVGGYWLVGNPRALNHDTAQAAPPDAEAGHVTTEQIEAMTEKLSARLKEHPDDADGWAMLGRTYAVLGRHQEAVPAFKKALTLRSGDAMLLADYADALAVASGRSMEGEPNKLIAQALEIDPKNLKALSLAGTAAFDRKDYAGALRHWEKMVQVDPNSELVKQIKGGIDEARALMGGQAVASTSEPAPPPPETAPAMGTSVSGVVTLAPSLAAKAAPTDTLFVFARAFQGSPMPLAILRKQVKDLPLTFMLDDSMAMSPAARLSSAERVVVGARISKRGDAMAQAGDLRGVSAPVSLGTSGLKIEISEVVGP